MRRFREQKHSLCLPWTCRWREKHRQDTPSAEPWVLNCGWSVGDCSTLMVLAVLFAQLPQQHIEATSTSATVMSFRRGLRTFHIALPMIVPLSGGTVRSPSIVWRGVIVVAVALAEGSESRRTQSASDSIRADQASKAGIVKGQ